jgi:hypothetical protein
MRASMVLRLVRLVQRRPLTSLSDSMSVMSCSQQGGADRRKCKGHGKCLAS